MMTTDKTDIATCLKDPSSSTGYKWKAMTASAQPSGSLCGFALVYWAWPNYQINYAEPCNGQKIIELGGYENNGHASVLLNYCPSGYAIHSISTAINGNTGMTQAFVGTPGSGVGIEDAPVPGYYYLFCIKK